MYILCTRESSGLSIVVFIFTAESLRQVSTGFAIGFGSFVDKGILPFGKDLNER